MSARSAGKSGIYRPLNTEHKEIRLLLVQPGWGSSPVMCELKHAFLDSGDEKPSYETISYTWGDSTVRGRIQIHGVVVDVPMSSEQALRRMRLNDRIRALWIDAVCINQEDLEERSVQVTMMGDIYANGLTNLVWLGPDDGSMGAALKSINAIVREMKQQTNGLEKLHETLYKSNKPYYSPTALTVPIDRDAVLALYSNEWFRRLWVVQEAALSPNSICHCGKYEVSLADTLCAAGWIMHKRNFLPDSFSDSVRFPAILFNQAERRHGVHARMAKSGDAAAILLTILTDLRNFGASDPRDHVFSILGLYRLRSKAADLPMELLPDYTATLENVLRNVTRFIMRQRGDLAILECTLDGFENTDSFVIPTWIPRWDHKWDPEYHPTSFRTTGFEAADDNAELFLEDSDDDETLVLRGILLGTVQETALLNATTPNDVLLDLEGTASLASCVESKDERERECIVGLTLQGGATDNYKPADQELSGHIFASYKRFLREKQQFPKHYLGMSEEHRSIAEFSQARINACRKRRFFNTTCARIGLGPRTMQKGDTLAILYGSRWPAILRLSEHRAEHYEFLGRAYVHGVMDGSAVQEHKAAGREDVIFRIC